MSLKGTLKLLHELSIAFNVSNQVELHDRVGWDIWCLILESTVHVDSLVVIRPNGVSESLNRIEFLPF